MISSKLDGRFQFDKKTKLLVGHPSPIATLSTGCIDPEERFNNSMKKLKAVRFVDYNSRQANTFLTCLTISLPLCQLYIYWWRCLDF